MICRECKEREATCMGGLCVECDHLIGEQERDAPWEEDDE